MATPISTICSIQSIGSCSICSAPFTDPRLLPCLHVYCKSCLESLQSESEGSVLTCPSCYKTTTLPSALLPKHIKVEREAAVLKMKQQASAEATCGSCEEVSVLEAYCHDCSSSICANCADSHKKLKPLKRHKVVSLQSVRSNQQSIGWKLSYCSRHDGETVRFYCFGCSSLICSECIKYHKEHKWEPLDVVAEAEKAEIKCLLPQMDDSISPITEAIQEVSSVIEDVAVNKDRLNKRITELFNKIAEVVAKRRQELLEEVDKSSLAKTTQLDIQKEGLEKIKNSLQLATDTMTAACSEYDSVELLSVKYHVQHAAKECLKDSKAVERSPVCASNLTFVADENILETLSEFAEVKESISTTVIGEAIVLAVDDAQVEFGKAATLSSSIAETEPREKVRLASSSPKAILCDEYQYKSQKKDLALIEQSVSAMFDSLSVQSNVSSDCSSTVYDPPPVHFSTVPPVQSNVLSSDCFSTYDPPVHFPTVYDLPPVQSYVSSNRSPTVCPPSVLPRKSKSASAVNTNDCLV